VKCNVVCNLADTNTGVFSACRTRWGNSAIALKAARKQCWKE